jgi:hypothetical protein
MSSHVSDYIYNHELSAQDARIYFQNLLKNQAFYTALRFTTYSKKVAESHPLGQYVMYYNTDTNKFGQLYISNWTQYFATSLAHVQKTDYKPFHNYYLARHLSKYFAQFSGDFTSANCFVDKWCEPSDANFPLVDFTLSHLTDENVILP